jgi:hypothetical protein
MTFRGGSVDPKLDVRGVDTIDSARTLTEESSFFGKPQAGQTGAAASIVAGAAAGEMRVTGVTGMTAESVGRFLTITGAASGGNNGTFLISVFTGATSIDVVNAAAVIPDGNNGAISWTERDPYAIQDNIQFTQTDRAAIKGVAYDAAIPTYQRPDAIGTNVPANLSNIASNTLDACAEVVNEKIAGALRPGFSGVDGTVAISDETYTTTDMHFVAGDLDSFVTLTDGTATGATGTYRIKAVTDGQTVELDGLAATGAGTVTGVLEGDLKGLLTSVGYADAVNRVGHPIADTGAEDETVYEATFAEVIDPVTAGGIVEEDGDRIFARTFGDQKDPNNTATNEGTRVFVQLLTGLNTGAAVDSNLEDIAGRSGSAASVTNATNNITGLTGMVSGDVGSYISLTGTSVDGNQRHALITAFVSATEVTVDGAAFATDANSGSLVWALSRHPATFDFYIGNRFRCDNLSETARRTTLIGGIVSDAELVLDISQIRDTIGSADGDTDLNAYLTNTGNFYAFSDLPDATPTVVEALNTLNGQIGNRDYTGAILTDGETITASLQALSNNIASASVVRTVERLTADILAGTAHTLPGAQTYTLDGTDNGQNMDVHWRKQLRDPGPATTASNDYEETSTTQITPYTKIKSGDSINYHIRQ